MSQSASGFDICLPGIVAGLILAAVVLAMGEALFPDPFQQVFPHQTFVVLPIAIGAASAVGLVSLLFHFQGDEEKPRQHIPSNDLKNKNRISSGGTDAL
jgi:hypothetical protein